MTTDHPPIYAALVAELGDPAVVPDLLADHRAVVVPLRRRDERGRFIPRQRGRSW